jgi:hypothetical protein
MLYDDLAAIHSDLEWALLEIRFKLRFRPEFDSLSLKRADSALDRLHRVVAELAPHKAEQPRTGSAMM